MPSADFSGLVRGPSRFRQSPLEQGDKARDLPG